MKDIKLEKMDMDVEPIVKLERFDVQEVSAASLDVKPVVKLERFDVKQIVKKENLDVKLKCQNCPVCLCNFDLDTVLASPNVCQHIFCLECLQEWSKKVNTCPIDRKVYSHINVKNIFNQNLRKIKVKDRTQQHRDEYEQDLTFCEVCRQPNREDRMLLCDSCDRGYHCECLSPPIDEIPEGEWFCSECVRAGRGRNTNVPSTSHSTTQVRVIARTNFAERVRRNVNENRRTRSVLNTIENNRTIVRRKATPRRKIVRRRRKVKRIRRTFKRRTIKKEPGIKIKSEPGVTIKSEPGAKKSTSTRKRRTKRRTYKRRKVRRVSKKSSKSDILKLNVLNIKKKYKLSNRTPKERILKRIINEQERKATDMVPSSEKLSNVYNGIRSVNDEDFASVQLTSQTSQFFEEFYTKKNEEKPKSEPKACSSSSFDLLDSIMCSQKILKENSSKIKLNVDGSIQLLKKNNTVDKLERSKSQQNPIKQESPTPKTLVKSESSVEAKKSLEKNDIKLEKNILPKQSASNLIELDRPCIQAKNLANEKIIKSEKIDPIKCEPSEMENNQANTSRYFSSNSEHKIPILTKEKSESMENHKEKQLPKSKSFGDGVAQSDYIQDQIALICKTTIKPFYNDKTINKEDYKVIMKKVVTKVRTHVKDLSMLNSKKVADLALAYVDKIKLERKTRIHSNGSDKIKEEIDKMFDD